MGGSNPYWDGVARHWLATRPQRLWRAYSDLLNARLCEAWLPAERVARALKTDLFDEATSSGLVPLLSARAASVVGIDVSERVLQGAAPRPGFSRVQADVRRLPFASATFDLVLSNSTLDHFGSLDEVGQALRELRRVLRPGGELVLTLDNLANPVVALRNALPARLLIALGMVPYRMGETCGPARLTRLAAEAGLEPIELGTMMHCPRLLAVLAAGWLEGRGPRTKARLFRALDACEGLGRWPSRFLTGYFLTLRARRPQEP